MSAAPRWIDEVFADFGRGAGIQNLTLGEHGVASLSGDRGLKISFEYVDPDLVICMTIPVTKTSDTAKKVLSLAAPLRRGSFTVRTGFMMKDHRAFFAVRIAQENITIPVLTTAFNELRRMADRFTGGVA